MMSKKLVEYILIDPRQSENRIYIELLFNSYVSPSEDINETYLYSFSPYKLVIEEQETEVMLLFPLIYFRKYRKRDAEYLYVIDIETSDSGAFGVVSPVIGRWKIEAERFDYREKVDPKARRIMKVTYFRYKEIDEDKYQIWMEQQIASAIPHLAAHHRPWFSRKRGVMLMQRQPGMSMDKLIRQLHANPGLLCETEYLKLSINLLDALRKQAHDITIPVAGGASSYVVHSDIKPGNIMVNGVETKLIDYNLANLATNNLMTQRIPRRGTRDYQDPRVMDRSLVIQDETTDLYSAIITLSELFHDRTQNQNLLRVKMDYPLTGILEGFSGFDESEKRVLITFFYRMTRYSLSRRFSHTQAVDILKNLLWSHSFKLKRALEAGEALSDAEMYDAIKSGLIREVYLARPIPLDRLQQFYAIQPRFFNLDIQALEWLSEFIELDYISIFMCSLQNETMTLEKLNYFLDRRPELSGIFLKSLMELRFIPDKVLWIDLVNSAHRKAVATNTVYASAKHSRSFAKYYQKFFLEQDRYGEPLAAAKQIQYYQVLREKLDDLQMLTHKRHNFMDKLIYKEIRRSNLDLTKKVEILEFISRNQEIYLSLKLWKLRIHLLNKEKLSYLNRRKLLIKLKESYEEISKSHEPSIITFLNKVDSFRKLVTSVEELDQLTSKFEMFRANLTQDCCSWYYSELVKATQALLEDRAPSSMLKDFMEKIEKFQELLNKARTKMAPNQIDRYLREIDSTTIDAKYQELKTAYENACLKYYFHSPITGRKPPPPPPPETKKL